LGRVAGKTLTPPAPGDTGRMKGWIMHYIFPLATGLILWIVGMMATLLINPEIRTTRAINALMVGAAVMIIAGLVFFAIEKGA
jgi:uncharacterized membrane-anchored protein